MEIKSTDMEDIHILKQWFTSQETSYHWGGPGLRFPFNHERFLQDIFWGKMPSYSYKNINGDLIGFGQYYEKAQRCHLARLAINPLYRGKGLGREFIAKLMSVGTSDLGLAECSLFVLSVNKKAIACYRALGFIAQPYPEGHPYFDDIEFMVAARQK